MRIAVDTGILSRIVLAVTIKRIDMVLPAATALAGFLALVFWLSAVPVRDVELRVVDQDAPRDEVEELIDLDGTLVRFDGTPVDLPGSWPRFRGPDRNGISPEPVRLAREWPQGGPPVLWSVDVGEGYAGAAIHNGRVYIHDYDHEAQEDVIRCLSLEDGRDIWRYSYYVPIRRNHGMSRTVPAVTEQYLVSIGPRCHVTALDAVTGERLWAMDLVTEFGTRVPPWYTGQCPLIDGDRVILAPGGPDALLIAVDIATGEVIWKTENPRQWQMSHSSIVKMELHGRQTYVYAAAGGVAGVDAEDGAILWKTGDWRINVATVPTPVIIDESRIFLSGGYNAGAMMINIERQSDVYTVETLFRLRARTFGADQHTPVFHDDHIFGVIPSGELACLDLDGERLWTSGSAHRFGLGPYMLADGLLLLMNDSGLLTMAEVSTREFILLDEARVLDGHESWAPMALAGGRLIVRDFTRMICLDIREDRL